MKIQKSLMVFLMMFTAFIFNSCRDNNAAVPYAPENLVITSGSRNVTLSWDMITDADSYNIYYRTAPGVTVADYKLTDVTSPYTHSSLHNGTIYYYAVTAVNDKGESALSAEVSAMPSFTAADVKKILAPDSHADDWFGWSVSIDGDYAIVGAVYAFTEDSSPNAAYIFHRTGPDSWDAGTKITAPDPEAEDDFGCSVSISGDYAIVGAANDDEKAADAGAVYIFHRTDTNTWDSGTKITPSDPETEDFFGGTVSISGDYAVAGSPNKNGLSGAAYFYHRTGINTWNEEVKITPSDTTGSDAFGGSVSISGYYALIGASLNDEKNEDAGAAYVYHRTGANTWTSAAKLTAPDAQEYDNFGGSVSIDGDYAVISAIFKDSRRGAAYIFHRIDENTWDAGIKITAFDPAADDFFGSSVSISGDYAVVSAPYKYEGMAMAGAAYIFHRTGANTWDTGTKITAPDCQEYDHFGWAVSISGDYAVISKSRQEGWEELPPVQGAVYFY